MHTQLHDIVAAMAAPARRRARADLRRHDRHLRRAVAGGAGLRLRAWPRSASSGASASAIYLDKRIETVVSVFGASAAGGVFVPVNPVLQPQAGRLHPRRLQRARPRDDGRALRAAARGARRLHRRSSTSSSWARRRSPRPTPAMPSTAGTPSRARPTSRPRARHRRRHGRDPLHVGQHGQAEGRRALAPQPPDAAARASASTSRTTRTT